MKLKSLLLGSAAAMIAVTGARAADAVIAEPEPMEYVKVCDMYGAGFFYIPGTETCLKFDGYVRVDASYNTDDPADIAAGGDGDHGDWDVRARVNIDARNETDWGTLRSQIRFQADGDASGDPNVGIDRALISLAGFRLGYSDSFTTTFHGYGLPIEKNDGFYGYDQAIFFDYTYTTNGFSIGGGVQDSDGTLALGAGANDIQLEYYIGAKYAGSWGHIAASYIYEDRPIPTATTVAVTGGAWKVSGRVTAYEGLDFRAFYAGDGSGDDTRQVNGTGDWAWGVGASYQIMDTLTLAAVYSDRDQANGGFFAVGANWTPVPGLRVSPEARFNEDDSEQYTVRVYRTW